eukprot:2265386-Rhodomonas_salina.4
MHHLLSTLALAWRGRRNLNLAQPQPGGLNEAHCQCHWQAEADQWPPARERPSDSQCPGRASPSRCTASDRDTVTQRRSATCSQPECAASVRFWLRLSGERAMSLSGPIANVSVDP